jgi:hypothetical protein
MPQHCEIWSNGQSLGVDICLEMTGNVVHPFTKTCLQASVLVRLGDKLGIVTKPAQRLFWKYVLQMSILDVAHPALHIFELAAAV